MPETTSNSTAAPKAPRWRILGAGLLLLALALIVIYTSRAAFASPLALVVVAAIGLVALLLQLRLRKDLNPPVHAPLWSNVLGVLLAITALCGDFLHRSPNFRVTTALGAVLCFAVSGIAVLHALRNRKV